MEKEAGTEQPAKFEKFAWDEMQLAFDFNLPDKSISISGEPDVIATLYGNLKFWDSLKDREIEKILVRESTGFTRVRKDHERRITLDYLVAPEEGPENGLVIMNKVLGRIIGSLELRS